MPFKELKIEKIQIMTRWEADLCMRFDMYKNYYDLQVQIIQGVADFVFFGRECNYEYTQEEIEDIIGYGINEIPKHIPFTQIHI